MAIQKAGVIGAGQMGGGIAQVLAVSGFQVILQDIDLAFCKKALSTIGGSLAKFVEKGKLSEGEREVALKRITVTSDLADLRVSDIIIEAATEQEGLKLEIFKKLESLCPATTILASNTSSISITRIAAATTTPQRVIGMHFMNPVPVMKGVEIIRGMATSDETEKAVLALAAKLGKTAVRSHDAPGFIANRVLMPMINEAIAAFGEGVATKEDIDECMKACCNFPMGPLALADLIGLDTVLAILSVMHRDLGEPRYRPNPLLRKYVDAGWLGRKSGRGFFTY